ncbi:hypothetical protein GCM10022223_37890 [Kineosporia mesophila]|uniref:Nudix hydrolase domain-containing protein n=1 Tax=Kineosporia mesophila TaxID=566012 RepID=A0ABP6ZRU6_9ACTN|nr:NUDIX domain-containing protein [Kineosporia mesophila]MCD5349788.1 NUDIX domain-containing protein [Kineosporia mesophila]
MTDTALPAAIDSHTLLVAAVIVHDQDKEQVLLLQRAAGAKFAPLHWDLPVGKAEKGEAITTTAARELHEETGLMVKAEDLQVAGIIHGAWGVEAPNGFLTVVFVTTCWTGEPINAEPHKHKQVSWHPTTNIPTDFVSTTRAALGNYVDRNVSVFTEGF